MSERVKSYQKKKNWSKKRPLNCCLCSPEILKDQKRLWSQAIADQKSPRKTPKVSPAAEAELAEDTSTVL